MECLQVHATTAEKGHVCPILQQVSFRIDRVLQNRQGASQAEAGSKEVALWPPDDTESTAKLISGNLRQCRESRRLAV